MERMVFIVCFYLIAPPIIGVGKSLVQRVSWRKTDLLAQSSDRPYYARQFARSIAKSAIVQEVRYGRRLFDSARAGIPLLGRNREVVLS